MGERESVQRLTELGAWTSLECTAREAKVSAAFVDYPQHVEEEALRYVYACVHVYWTTLSM